MNFFERAAQSLLGGTKHIALAQHQTPLSASSSGVSSDISSPDDGRRSNTRSPMLNNTSSDTDDDITDTEDDSGIADAHHDLTARAKRFFPDLGISEVAIAASAASSTASVAQGANTLNTFLTYW